MKFSGWGQYPRFDHDVFGIFDRSEILPSFSKKILPYGLGRSYGDSCLNNEQALILTKNLDKFISFDAEKGILKCEAGCSFEKILSFVMPRGWFLPVTPGTQYVTVGGAIANDVHGKNHHVAGSFGHHLLEFELLRSDGSRIQCTRTVNPEYFSATVGGLGLTGLITWASFKLIPISSYEIEQEALPFSTLKEFFEISESSQSFPYTVAWIDCLRDSGRGVFFRGRHRSNSGLVKKKEKIKLSVPFTPPFSFLIPLSVKMFNDFYFLAQKRKFGLTHVNYDSFFYPLDSVNHWNRIYGKKGLLQYQCVVPYEKQSSPALQKVLSTVAKNGSASFLAVLKTFGDAPSLGYMSFPRKGVTLAMDFPVTNKCLDLLNHLDKIVSDHGGAVYPAKDARMNKETFLKSFPNLNKFLPYRDVQFSSSFIRRMGL